MSRRKSRRRINIQNLITMFLFLILGLIVANALFDWINYNRGHRAFLAGICSEAIHLFDRVIPGPKFLDPAQFSVLAQIEKDECLIYQEAFDKQVEGEFGEALLAYLDFLESHPESGLTEAIRTRSTALFAEADPLSLANDTICLHTPALLEHRLMPQREVNLPLFYLSCAHYYDQTNKKEQSYTAYVAFLTEYPEHSAGRDAEAGLLSNPLACQKPNLLRDSLLAEREDFMPKLYYTCGLDFEVAGEFDDAIAMFSTFLKEYPEHRFAGQMKEALARSLVEQAKIMHAEVLEPPQRSGRTQAGGTVIFILNNSPYEIRVAFKGPDTMVGELLECDGCQVYNGEAPSSCQTGAQAGQYNLLPGNYEVVIEVTTSEGKQYWLGEWELQEGDSYRSCFSMIEKP